MRTVTKTHKVIAVVIVATSSGVGRNLELATRVIREFQLWLNSCPAAGRPQSRHVAEMSVVGSVFVHS